MFLPTVIDTKLDELKVPTGAIRQLAETVATSTTEWTRPVADNNTGIAQWLTESGSPTNTTPTYTDRKPSFGILGAEITVLHTAIEDLAYDPVADAFYRAKIDFARKEADAFMNGVTGPVTGPASILANIDGVEAAAVNLASITALIGDMHPDYLFNASFVMSSKTFHSLLGLTDDNGAPIASHSLLNGSPRTLMGYPVYFDAFLPADTPVLFGDFKAGYLIADRVGTTLKVNPFGDFAGVKLWIRKRVGGVVTIRDAIKAISIA